MTQRRRMPARVTGRRTTALQPMTGALQRSGHTAMVRRLLAAVATQQLLTVLLTREDRDLYTTVLRTTGIRIVRRNRLALTETLGADTV